ncbi:hypothetical protein GXP67_07215 [Rhodocytophaga rosea]|uniref:DUF5675 domain-containing protein n=1 Tax=Rhodocytophaga rosea TaxID=2704465 RepID=A0A6C0GET3_9BACT|nr:DUF5675 family protein [Rhodocytophaga rosea]QHT66458.1 hypothetical protein GXP67_07215 [Rhodocytophaga rosea]
MKHAAALFFIAVLAITILLFFTNPEWLEKVWLWIIGFIGYIILLFEKGFRAVTDRFRRATESTDTGKIVLADAVPVVVSSEEAIKTAQLQQRIVEVENQLKAEHTQGHYLSDSTLTVLRYLDDGQTTLGLLFVRKKFFAYTLEDTRRKDKVAGETRIPAGIYPLVLNQSLTALTTKYRQLWPWFEYHLEIQNIPGFAHVYLHVGNTHEDTKGCLLIADGVNAASTTKMISHSRIAFERLYKTIHALLLSGEEVHIRIMDEDWFERSKLSTS